MIKKILIILLYLLFISNINAQLWVIQPKDNQIVYEEDLIFEWNHISDTNNYELIISTDSNFSNIVYSSGIITYNTDTISNLSYGKYYWKIIYNTTINTDTSLVYKFIIFNPNAISNINTWLNPDSIKYNSTDSLIYKWTDATINNNFAFQNDTNLQPKLSIKTLNNYHPMQFDGINDFLQLKDSIENPFSLYFLIDIEEINTYSIFSDISHNDGLIYFFFPDKIALWRGSQIQFCPFTTGINFYNIHHANTSIFFKKNSANMTLASSGPINNIKIKKIGTSTYKPFLGKIYEIIGFNDTISAENKYLVEQYLRYKYAPPVNLGYNIHIPYGFCDTTLDAGTRFANYIWSTGDTTQTITVNQSGQYSVNVTDIFGFESSDSLMIYYPQINEQLDDTLICFGDTIKWNTGLQDTNYTFLWQNSQTDSIHSIYSAGDYYVQITDTFGCSFNSDTAHITIDNYPITTTLGNDTSLCAGQNLYLQVGASETAYYTWSTGSTNDNITINSANDYSVTATNTIGCVATDTINIQIHGNAPVVGFDYANLCFTDSTVFTDTSLTTDNSNIISWNWDFGNFETSNQQNPTIQYADTGIFSVSLTVLTDSNCTNLLMKNIEIHSLPVSNYTNTQLCQETNINFTNLSTIPKGNITSYYWDFGNGDFSTDTNPTYTYTNYGYYDIQLISTSYYNCKDTLKQQIEIKPSPISDFLTSATCRDKVISFYNNSSSLPYNPVYETHWDFGDGTTSDGENPNYLFYGSDTIYNVSLEIKSINGCRDSVVKQIQLYNNPKANFTNDKICAETYTQLTNNSSITNDTITSYVWQIGNNFYYNENPIVFFNQAGQTNISLTTTSIHGCTDNYQEYIPVLELPNPDFDIVPQWGITNEYTVFISQNEGDNFWNFGNGNTATDSVSYTVYPDSGMYIIEHIVVDSNNCVDTIYKDYRVVIPQNDIAITEVRYTINNNILSVETDIINIGNLPVNKIKLTLSPDKYSSISEIWEGELIYGSGMTYTFNASYTIFDNKVPDYICVIADIDDKYTDTNPSNNTYCTDNNNIVLYPIYPNPSSDYINISFKLNSSSNVIISLYDNKGKLITNINNQNYDKGFHKLTYDISKLSKASYTIRISINNNTETTKFIKN